MHINALAAAFLTRAMGVCCAARHVDMQPIAACHKGLSSPLPAVVCHTAGLSHFLSMASWLPPVRWLLAHLMTRVQAETAAMVGKCTLWHAGFMPLTDTS
jgi:hypothetical protein